MKNKKSPVKIGNFNNYYPELTKNLLNISDTLNINFRGLGLNSSLLRALKMNSSLQSSISLSTNLPNLASTNFLPKKMELIKGVPPKTINPSLISSCNYQKSYLFTIKSPTYLKLIKPKLFESTSKANQLIYTVPDFNKLNKLKYDQMISSARNSMKKYQNTFDFQKFIPKFPRELFCVIGKNQIMSVAKQYQNIDFRIPNITEEIIDKTEVIIDSENSSDLIDEPEEMIIHDTDIRAQKDQPNIYYGEFLDIIAGYIKITFDEKFDKKIQVNGKTDKISNFLLTYPNFVRNTLYALLLSYMLISGFNNINDFVARIIQILKILLGLIN